MCLPPLQGGTKDIASGLNHYLGPKGQVPPRCGAYFAATAGMRMLLWPTQQQPCTRWCGPTACPRLLRPFPLLAVSARKTPTRLPRVYVCVCSKLNLGLGAFGRSWTLDNQEKSDVGAAARAWGLPGNCTGLSPPAFLRACLSACLCAWCMSVSAGDAFAAEICTAKSPTKL